MFVKAVVTTTTAGVWLTTEVGSETAVAGEEAASTVVVGPSDDMEVTMATEFTVEVPGILAEVIGRPTVWAGPEVKMTGEVY